jgi:copper chaperone CopZ
MMGKAYFKVKQQFCGECSLALRRFIGGMDGVKAVAVDFDERKIPEEQVQKLARDSIEKLGYRVDED